ncbi:hypothetical protein [Jiella avicenniae]|uniref:DUF937 domain-containing protein n=1 Tax=Jiella avicenniae TaxID=2907202 RepID=A0A9X1P3F9_9HYPH|nr:hypothetical protein [Jiella avicenniae]MCE7029044.1 hypothetical protein [Jiella avicenniae]
MTDFFDWLTASDSGVAADRLADTFKLSHEELRKTMTALAPAFALALQRAMIVPGAWSDIARHYQPFVQSEASDFPVGATNSPLGRDLSNALFGSKDLVSSVARHVSVASGVAPDTVEMMIRNVAVMTIGTMLQMMMANLTRSQPKGLAEGDYPGAMAEMLRRSANAVEAMGRPSDQPPPGRRLPMPMPGSDYLNQMFSNALTGTLPWLPPETGEGRSETRAPQKPAAAPADRLPPPHPAAMEEFFRGFRLFPPMGEAPSAGAGSPPPPPAPSAPPAPKREEVEARAGAPAESLAETALAFQQDYARRMLELFAPKPALRNDEPEKN